MGVLSNKYKTYLLYGILTLLGYLLYQKFFVKTIQIIKETSVLNEELSTRSADDRERLLLQTQLKTYDQILINDSVRTDPGSLLLDFISHKNTTDLTLEDFQPPAISSVGQFQIHTQKLQLSGSYVNLLKMAYTIEKDYKGGHLAYLVFHKTENHHSNDKKLIAEMAVQYVSHK